jgi:nitric oxide reductase large subunit
LSCLLLLLLLLLLLDGLVQVVDKVAPGTIGTKSYAVIGLAQIGLVFWMSGYGAHISMAMSKLAFFAIFTRPVLGKRSAQLRLVTASVDLCGCRGRRGCGGC